MNTIFLFSCLPESGLSNNSEEFYKFLWEFGELTREYDENGVCLISYFSILLMYRNLGFYSLWSSTSFCISKLILLDNLFF